MTDFSLPTLTAVVICITGLGLVFYRWHRLGAINLKQPHWILLIGSFSLGLASFSTALLLAYFSNQLPPTRTPPDALGSGPFDGLIFFVLAPLIMITTVWFCVSLIWCLFRLARHLVRHFRPARVETDGSPAPRS